MIKFNLKFTAGAALTALLLAGCGGGSSGSIADANQPGGNQTITDVVAYINSLIATVDGNSDPTDINGFTLASDDTAEPTALN